MTPSMGMAFTCTTLSFSLNTNTHWGELTGLEKGYKHFILPSQKITMVHTTAIHLQALPAGRQRPRWTFRHCPHLGCPSPLTLRYQSPSLNPGRKVKTCKRGFYSVSTCVCVCARILGPVIPVTCHAAACVLYMVIKGIFDMHAPKCQSSVALCTIN